MKIENDLTGVKVGDILFSLRYGEVEIVKVVEGDRYHVFFYNNGYLKSRSLDGRDYADNAYPDLFWSKPEIIAPPKPKRMVTKTIEGWANVYNDNSKVFHSNKASADRNAQGYRIACVKLTGSYEVEE